MFAYCKVKVFVGICATVTLVRSIKSQRLCVSCAKRLKRFSCYYVDFNKHFRTMPYLHAPSAPT